jgi:hypothetical protein
MKKAKVILDGKEYTVKELRHKANAAWRERIKQPINELFGALNGLETELNNVDDLVQVVQSISGNVIGSVDVLSDLLVGYAPELKDAVDEGYDSEIVDAFVEVLKLAFPFGSVVKMFKSLGAKAQ